MKQILFTLLMLSVTTLNAQESDRWKLCINNKKIASGTQDAPGNATISRAAKGKFIIRYSGNGKNDKNRSMIIFDTERHELIRKDIKNNFGKFSISVETLKAKTKGKTFQIFTVAIPKDPEEAALVRMAPMLLCEVGWTN